MSAHPGQDWHAVNQQRLLARLSAVREELVRYMAQAGDGNEETGHAAEHVTTVEASHADEPQELSRQADGRAEEQADGQTAANEDDAESLPTTLEALCAGFGLSAFERDVLLLCAGV